MNLIVPSKAETAITGFILAAEKTNRKTVWRVEFWNGKVPLFTRNGSPVEIKDLPCSIAKFGREARRYAEGPRA